MVLRSAQRSAGSVPASLEAEVLEMAEGGSVLTRTGAGSFLRNLSVNRLLKFTSMGICGVHLGLLFSKVRGVNARFARRSTRGGAAG